MISPIKGYILFHQYISTCILTPRIDCLFYLNKWLLQLISTICFSHWFQKCNIVTDGFVDLFTSICLFNLLDIGDWITMRGGLIQPIYMPVIANKMCENEPPKLNEALHYLSSSTASILFLYQSSLSLLHHTFLVFSRMDLTVLSIFQKTVI